MMLFVNCQPTFKVYKMNNKIIGFVGVSLGVVIGSASSGYYLKQQELIKNEEIYRVNTLQNLVYISKIHHDDSSGAMRLMSSVVADNIQHLRTTAKGRGEASYIARETIKQVEEWRVRHASIPLDQNLQHEIDGIAQNQNP